MLRPLQVRDGIAAGAANLIFHRKGTLHASVVTLGSGFMLPDALEHAKGRAAAAATKVCNIGRSARQAVFSGKSYLVRCLQRVLASAPNGASGWGSELRS
jgi:hypothetical protein